MCVGGVLCKTLPNTYAYNGDSAMQCLMAWIDVVDLCLALYLVRSVDGCVVRVSAAIVNNQIKYEFPAVVAPIIMKAGSKVEIV